MSNWYEAWADRYAEWSAGVTADVPFYVALAREADGLLVELAVGNGRVAIPVAQATDRRVVGIDSSPAMLAQARERAVEAEVELDLREEDIREVEIEEPAAMIYCPGRPLLHLPRWADRRRCFESSPHRFDLTAASPGRVRLRPSDRIRHRRPARRHTVAAHDPLPRQR
jgi:SAM-dependent methyltransferase